jgi:hypothetical protein
MSGSLERERAYLPRGKRAHLLRYGDSANGSNAALCGLSPAFGDTWRGTGTQDEYERAAELPVCVPCAEWDAS